MSHNRSKKQLFSSITEYGIHIWAILLIANATLVYAYHFATNAAGKAGNIPPILHSAKTSPMPNNTLVNTTVEQNDEQVKPKGPSLNIVFTLPGIGSGSANMTPKHLTRDVIVFLYAPDVNSVNASVSPLYAIKGTVRYDSDKNSPTYSSYINHSFDLGSDVQDGDYQITYRTDQSLRMIVKENPGDIGGERIGLGKQSPPVIIPTVQMLMGDSVPDDGDNRVDISDYNALINCYADKNSSALCQTKHYGDFDDNGVVDGIDYNIFLRSLNVLAQEGMPIPQISTSPTPAKKVSKLSHLVTPTTKPKITPKKTAKSASSSATTKTKKESGGNALVSGVIFLIFLIILGVIGFVLYKKIPFIHDKINALIHLSPTGKPATEQITATEAKTPPEPTTINTTDVQPAPVTSTDTVDSTADIAANTEIPVAEIKPSPAPAQPTEPTTPPAPETPKSDTSTQPASSTQPANGEIEKEYYVKKKGPDEAGTGEWLLLTDDNGPLQAHYSKNDAADGFAKIKGVMKTEKDKTYLEISQITVD